MEKGNTAKRNYILPLVIIAVLFYVIGFGVGISGFLTPFLQEALHLEVSQSYLVTAAIFSAFVLFGSPAGRIIKKAGYRKSIFLALVIMALGMALFVPSAKFESFPVFLIALFISGIGNTLLQASVNPYVTIVGPAESAAMRMCLMGIMNKLAWWLGPLFLGLFLNLEDVRLDQIYLPFYLVTGILLALSVFIYFSKLPEVKAEGEDEDIQTNKTGERQGHLSRYPHLIMGIAALFLYVGVETLPMTSIIGYAKAAFGGDIANPEKYALYVPLGMFAGYISGVILIPKILSQAAALRIFAIIGIIGSATLILLPADMGIYAFSLIGFANSVMWGAIWPLSIAGLGNYTKTGSSFLVMSIVGGAVIPLLFGFILDIIKTGNLPTVENYQSAYWIFIPAYLFILFFGLSGYATGKNRG
ncbi:MFS transporter [Dysgonomonas sp. GY75]|uniref:MFS transporter n=1 Tax=Dysgonomonas sp. GY75 TaxID=2780419 RepID=UPI0018845927|nr:MFS transporter [Dysgonomonas sp. GY75]MBF0647915.1 MFS transporter [Dysgonomonas sp. GY75]